MAQNFILEVKLFDVWRIDIMGPFSPSNKYKYILVTIDYTSKQVEVIACVTNDGKVVEKFLQKKILHALECPGY